MPYKRLSKTLTPVWQAILQSKLFKHLCDFGIIDMMHIRKKMMCDMIIEASHKKPDEEIIVAYIVSTFKLMFKPSISKMAIIIRLWKVTAHVGMWGKQDDKAKETRSQDHEHKSQDDRTPAYSKHQFWNYYQVREKDHLKNEEF